LVRIPLEIPSKGIFSGDGETPVASGIPSAARNPALIPKAERDSSSPPAPRNDSQKGYSHSLSGEAKPEQAHISRCDRTLRILLCEENEVSRRLAKRLLEKRGHQIVEASDTVQALEALEGTDGETVDLLLIDLDMSGMDAPETVHALAEKAHSRGKNLPVIAIRDQTPAGEDDDDHAAGVDGCVCHPLRVDDLLEMIHRLPEGRPQVERTSPPSTPPRPSARPRAFDKGRFMTRLDGDKALATEIVGMFLAECPKLMQEVCQAAAGGDLRALERAAHSLKGTASDMAAPEAFEASRALEQIAREGTPGTVRAALASLEGAIQRLLPELQDFHVGVE